MRLVQVGGRLAALTGLMLMLCVRIWAAEQIRVPDTPASVPLILAAMDIPELEAEVYVSHARAHVLFAKGEIRILATGLAPGIRLFEKGVPIRILNTYVSGLTWIVADRIVTNLSDLEGVPLVLPFEGSPIEEVARFFVRSQGFVWAGEIPVQYMNFQGSFRLLTLGKVQAAALPEPYATMASRQSGLFRGIGFQALWDKYRGARGGYPQVGVFVRTDLAAADPAILSQLNRAMTLALKRMARDPDSAVRMAAPYLSFDPELIRSSLDRIKFDLIYGSDLKHRITAYYQTIGRPLEDCFVAFF